MQIWSDMHMLIAVIPSLPPCSCHSGRRCRTWRGGWRPTWARKLPRWSPGSLWRCLATGSSWLASFLELFVHLNALKTLLLKAISLIHPRNLRNCIWWSSRRVRSRCRSIRSRRCSSARWGRWWRGTRTTSRWRSIAWTAGTPKSLCSGIIGMTEIGPTRNVVRTVSKGGKSVSRWRPFLNYYYVDIIQVSTCWAFAENLKSRWTFFFWGSYFFVPVSVLVGCFLFYFSLLFFRVKMNASPISFFASFLDSHVRYLSSSSSNWLSSWLLCRSPYLLWSWKPLSPPLQQLHQS